MHMCSEYQDRDALKTCAIVRFQCYAMCFFQETYFTLNFFKGQIIRSDGINPRMHKISSHIVSDVYILSPWDLYKIM